MSFTEGDTAPALSGTVSADLTGATPLVNILKPDGSLLSREADIVGDPTEGNWSMDWEDDDLDTIGQHLVEVEVTYASGKIQTFKNTLTGERNSFRVDAQLVATP